MSGKKDRADGRVLDRLFAVIESRQGGDPEASYTAKLLAGGVETVAAKVSEEAAETAIAAVDIGFEQKCHGASLVIREPANAKKELPQRHRGTENQKEDSPHSVIPVATLPGLCCGVATDAPQ